MQFMKFLATCALIVPALGGELKHKSHDLHNDEGLVIYNGHWGFWVTEYANGGVKSYFRMATKTCNKYSKTHSPTTVYLNQDAYTTKKYNVPSTTLYSTVGQHSSPQAHGNDHYQTISPSASQRSSSQKTVWLTVTKDSTTKYPAPTSSHAHVSTTSVPSVKTTVIYITKSCPACSESSTIHTKTLSATSCVTIPPTYITTTQYTTTTVNPSSASPYLSTVTSCKTYTIPAVTSWVWPSKYSTQVVPPTYATSMGVKCPTSSKTCLQARDFVEYIETTQLCSTKPASRTSSPSTLSSSTPCSSLSTTRVFTTKATTPCTSPSFHTSSTSSPPSSTSASIIKTTSAHSSKSTFSTSSPPTHSTYASHASSFPPTSAIHSSAVSSSATPSSSTRHSPSSSIPVSTAETTKPCSTKPASSSSPPPVCSSSSDSCPSPSSAAVYIREVPTLLSQHLTPYVSTVTTCSTYSSGTSTWTSDVVTSSVATPSSSLMPTAPSFIQTPAHSSNGTWTPSVTPAVPVNAATAPAIDCLRVALVALFVPIFLI